jgi:hypothetical protein
MPTRRKSLSPETVSTALTAVDALIETNRTEVAVSELAPLFNARAELIAFGGVETESGSNGAVKTRKRTTKVTAGSSPIVTVEA